MCYKNINIFAVIRGNGKTKKRALACGASLKATEI